MITDLNGNIEYINPKVTEVTGYSAAELLRTSSRILKSGETKADEYKQLWSKIQSGEWRGLFHNRKKNGELFWEESVIAGNSGSKWPPHPLPGHQGRRYAPQAAQEAVALLSEERFRVAAENSGDILFEWDLDSGTLEYLGPSVARFPDLSLPPNLDEWRKMVHPADLPDVLATVARHLEGEPFHAEYRIVENDGKFRYVDVAATLYQNAGSVRRKSIGVVTDVTARKAAERSNAELAAIVESADIGIFSGDLAGTIPIGIPARKESSAIPPSN